MEILRSFDSDILNAPKKDIFAFSVDRVELLHPNHAKGVDVIRLKSGM